MTTLTPGASFPVIELHCICGGEVDGPVPRKYKTVEFYRPIIDQWLRDHSDHLWWSKPERKTLVGIFG